MRSRVAKEARAQQRNRLLFLYTVVISILCVILVITYVLMRLYAPRITSVVVTSPSWLAKDTKVQEILAQTPNRFFLPGNISYVFSEKKYTDALRTAYPALDTITTSITDEVLTIAGTTYTPFFLVCKDSCVQGDVLGHVFIDPAFTATSTLYTVADAGGTWDGSKAAQIKGHISALEAASLHPARVLIMPEEYIYEIRYTADTSWIVRVPNTATEDYVSQAISSALSNAIIAELLKAKKLDTLDMRLQQRLFYTSI